MSLRCWIAGILLLPFVGCSTGRDSADPADRLLALESCPRGDAPWRDARDAARTSEALEQVRASAQRLSVSCAERWEPLWLEGEALKRLGQAADSLPVFERALARARRLEDPLGVACVADRFAGQLLRTGRLDDARELYAEALRSAKEVRRLDLESFTRNNFAGLLVDQGELAAAIEHLELAAAGLTKLGLEEAARGLTLNRATLHMYLGDALAAEQALLSAHELAVHAEDRWTIDASAIALGYLFRALEQPREARAWVERVDRTDPEMAIKADLGLGRVALREGRLDEAMALLERATGAAKDEPVAGLIAESFWAEAEIRAGRPDEARARLERVIAESDVLGAAKAGWIAHWLMGKWALAEGDAASAVTSLTEAVRRLEQQGDALDPAAEGMRYLRERFDPYADLAVAILCAAEVSQEEAAFGRVLEIMSRVQGRALRQEFSRERDLPAAPSIDSVRHALRSGEWVLSYLLGDDHGVVLAIARDRVEARTMKGRRALIDPLRRYRQALSQPAATSASSLHPTFPLDAWRLGTQLGVALLGPLSDLIDGAERLYIVADRELATVPFSALAWPSSSIEAERDEWRFVGDVVETATLALTGPPPVWSGPRAPVLLAGQPIAIEDPAFPELAWAAFELDRLQTIWSAEKTTLLTREQFTLEQLHELEPQRYPTLHFATHAVASTRDPRRCGVVLSGGERLGLDEISRWHLPPSLVILSACRTGEGEIVPGEGIVGLRWAFLRAGARGVVASHWTVDDVATAKLMIELHERLQRGVDPIRALALASRQIAAEKTHPAFWAPFVIVVRPDQPARAS
ncbi:MAG: CHAT domain-containing protein [Acidobacteriota bacterium]|nr:MAG: CHAT domain-containing protein [Acidobacteriota bacterium]